MHSNKKFVEKSIFLDFEQKINFQQFKEKVPIYIYRNLSI